MLKPRLSTITISFIALFVFAKIYQHNKMVTLLYKKQRLVNQKDTYVKTKNDLLVQLYSLKKPECVKQVAQEQLGLKPLELSHIITPSVPNQTEDSL